MKNLDIRLAALDETLVQRVRMAANALVTHRMHARVAAWDGTRCDLVVVAAEDLYGERVRQIAAGRGTPVLTLGGDGESVLPHHIPRRLANIATIVRILHDLAVEVVPVAAQPGRARETPKDSEGSCALVRLASQPDLARADIEASIDGLTVWLMPGLGRVLGADAASLREAAARLGSGGWTFRRLSPGEPLPAAAVASQSLEVFYLKGAWAARDELPHYPPGACRLAAWPDLGTAADIVEALQVVKALRRVGGDVRSIAEDAGIPMRETAACLWAFSAAGLVERAPDVPWPQPARTRGREKEGLLKRLARHFGLDRGPLRIAHT